MKKILFVVALAACGGGAKSESTTPSASSGEVGTLQIANKSHFDIHSIQLSPYDSVEWGDNLIGSDPLLHSEAAQVSVFDCKKYDLRMVDDENVECIVQDIDLCFEDKAWEIDDEDLAACATGWAD